ncbi:Hypothetical protein CINCED_3A014573 [Cinara cedri]|uniref:Uncharacterized protein n=1 Tax=Cinara cedri TaxID=506608 RepID=A0A5E4M1X2_9HEMI|nr:Hypothetical protein CINCED_3A014573 [Cinara cedri]
MDSITPNIHEEDHDTSYYNDEVATHGRLIPAKKKNKKEDSTEELMKMVCQRLKQPLDD